MQQSNNSILNGLIGHSSNFLLTAMVLSFFLMFGVQMFYYADSFKRVVPNIGFAFGVGICIGLFTQLVRLAFGLAGAAEFSKGRYGAAAGGLIFSFCVTLFEAFEVQAIAEKWGGNDLHLHDSLLLLFQFLLWTGFCLELRLAMNVSNGMSGKNEITFSTNGATEKAAKNTARSSS